MKKLFLTLGVFCFALMSNATEPVNSNKAPNSGWGPLGRAVVTTGPDGLNIVECKFALRRCYIIERTTDIIHVILVDDSEAPYITYNASDVVETTNAQGEPGLVLVP